MKHNQQTIHIIDDDRAFRKYLSELLQHEGYQVKSYHSADHFFENFSHDGIGCLIIDLRLPGISGLDLQQKLYDKNIDLPFIMITGYADVPTAVRAMKAGAIDFIEKPVNSQVLLERIHNAINIHQHITKTSTIKNQILGCMKTLTTREHEVMNHVVAGYQNKDIADKLGISVKTVEVHRSNTMEKMQANSVVDLVRMYLIVNNNDETNYNYQ
jgi:FixJ family two-component response regulator